jgi:hypothetical protein
MSGARARLGLAPHSRTSLLHRTLAVARLVVHFSAAARAAASPYRRARRPRAYLCPAHPPSSLNAAQQRGTIWLQLSSLRRLLGRRFDYLIRFVFQHMIEHKQSQSRHRDIHAQSNEPFATRRSVEHDDHWHR